jgi:hypothetical protein
MLSILGISPPVLFVAESHRRSRQHARLDRPHRMQPRQKAPGSRGGAPCERGEKAYERAVEARKRAGRPRGASLPERSRRAEPRPVHGTTEAIRRNFE